MSPECCFLLSFSKSGWDMARNIIIDTDPGQDDAVAILLALASPQELNILGITAVAGNVPLSLTQVNARKVCEVADRTDILVFAGHEKPLSRPLVTAEHVHGKTGLDGIELPAPTMDLQGVHAVEFIIETLRREPAGTVTLCPVGPLTNIADAMRRADAFETRLGRAARVVAGTAVGLAVVDTRALIGAERVIVGTEGGVGGKLGQEGVQIGSDRHLLADPDWA